MWTLIPNKVKAFLAAAGALIVAVFVAFMKGRKSGKETASASIQKETQKVEQKFQKIDAAPTDFDGAIGNLRRRGAKK